LVLKLERKERAAGSTQEAAPPIAVWRRLRLSEGLPVAALARLLHQKPSRIKADLIRLGVFASEKDKLDLETTVKVIELYGYIVGSEAHCDELC
jgi:hypothetical protein